MAEFLSPGIFIEEVSLSGQQVDAVGTSTMGIVGWTKQGVVDTATLVTSPDDFQRKFGGFTSDSLVPISISAFFSNGGSRAYVVRVVPSDAVAGESCITDPITDEIVGVGDGSDPGTISGTLANIPANAGTVTIGWRNNPVGTTTGEDPTFSPAEGPAAVGPHAATLANTPITDDDVVLSWTESVQAAGSLTFGNTTIVDGETFVLDDGTNPAVTFEFDDDSSVVESAVLRQVDITGLSTVDQLRDAAISAITGAPALNITATSGGSGVVTLVNDNGGAAGNVVIIETVSDPGFSITGMAGGTTSTAKTASIDEAGVIGGADAARLAAATIDRDTGALSITFNAAVPGTSNGPDADSITVDYDSGGSLQTLTDNGSGVFSTTTAGGTVVSGTIVYSTGVIDVTWTGGTDVPFDGNDLLASYTHCQWGLAAASEGAWASRLTLRVAGNENFFVSGTAGTADVGTFTKYDVSVLLEDETSGEDEVKETYEEVVFDDATDAMYFADLLNDSSDYVVVTDNSVLDVPATFKGVEVTGETLGTGDAVPTTAFTGTLEYIDTNPTRTVVKSSLLIAYTPVVGSARSLVSDALGNITGTGLDTTKTNTVDYDTGDFTLNFLGGNDAPKDAEAIVGSYVVRPETDSVDYLFTSGADGTVADLSYTDMTSPALEASKRGIYALARADEMMSVIVPDLAADTTAYGHILDYAEGRRDAFCIMCPPSGYTAQQAADFKRVTFSRKSKYGAFYWPWIRVADPVTSGRTILMPPMAHIAGIYARTDSTRNVGKAPGGTVDGALRYLIGLETRPDQGERDVVYPARVNPLVDSPQTGLAVWGVRTTSATNDVFKYVSSVRLFQFVEKSIFNSTHGLLFESINSNLYSLIKTQLDSFLLNLYNTGHFAGNTPDQAFFVIVDETNNPPEVANAGQVIVDVGIAPNRPGEFIRFRMSQKTITS